MNKTDSIKEEAVVNELNRIVSADELFYALDGLLQRYRMKAIKLPEALAKINRVLQQISGDYKRNYIVTKVCENTSSKQRMIYVPRRATKFVQGTDVIIVPVEDIMNKLDNSFLNELVESKAEEMFLEYYKKRNFRDHIRKVFRDYKEQSGESESKFDDEEIDNIINTMRVNRSTYNKKMEENNENTNK